MWQRGVWSRACTAAIPSFTASPDYLPGIEVMLALLARHWEADSTCPHRLGVTWSSPCSSDTAMVFFFLWGTFTDFYFRSVSSNTDSEKWDFLLIQFYLWLHFTIQSTCHGLTGGKLVLRTPITLRHNRIMGSIRQPHNLKQSENTFKQRCRLCFSAFLLMLKSH